MALGYTAKALKELEALPKNYAARVAAAARALETNPHPPGSLKLQGVRLDGDAVYRERVGVYRILYVVRAGGVIVVGVLHRREAYR